MVKNIQRLIYAQILKFLYFEIDNRVFSLTFMTQQKRV